MQDVMRRCRASPSFLDPDIVKLWPVPQTAKRKMISKDKFTAIVMTVVAWGLAGGLFGALYAGLRQALLVMGLADWQPQLAAAAAAAMMTAAFYSAMPLALGGAMAGVLASIGSLILFGHDPSLIQIVGIAGVTGLAIGSFQSWMTGGGGRPLTRTLAGLGAGLIAGAVLVLVIGVSGRDVGTFVSAAGAVALVGTLYEAARRWLVYRHGPWLPASLSAALVAGSVAVLVGAGIWMLGGSPTLALDGSSHDLVGQIRREIPPGFLGGLLGGGLTGMILELLGFQLEDHA